MARRVCLMLLVVLGLMTIDQLGVSQANQPSQSNQSKTNALISTTLVINEIDYTMPGGENAEFVELKNVSASTINLSGYKVELVDGATPTVYQTITLPSFNLVAGDYYVICGNSGQVPNCDLDIAPNIGLIQNGPADAVGLRTPANVLIDTVSYAGNAAAPYTETTGSGILDDGLVVNESIGRIPDGVDTD